MKQIIRLVFLAGYLFLISCSGNKKDEYAKEDQSFDVKWYMQYGMPDPATDWTFDDYSYALQLLSGIETRYPYSLPRLHSKKSGPLFEKLVSNQNFSFLKDTTSLKRKAKTLRRFSNIYDNLASLYYMPQTESQYYNRELIEIYLFGLKLSQRMLDVGRQIELAPDPALDEFKAGLFQVRDSYITLVAKTTGVTGKTNSYTEKDLVKLAESIAASIRKNIFWMNPTQKKILSDALSKVTGETPSAKIRKIYRAIIDELNANPQKPG